eukprot:c4681_g1_i1.p1 GENE.c4681_g1_i1~~c4681_g1_i1.p1  ORF type:complete len:433 (-),score=72.95 c4681_g1_i1:62-1360(-)
MWFVVWLALLGLCVSATHSGTAATSAPECSLDDSPCNCGTGCPHTNGVCSCKACGSCDNCGSCACCRSPDLPVPDSWSSHPGLRDGMFLFSNTSVPSHLMPNYGNGYIGTQFESGSLYVAGLFNGEGVWSHRAAVPNPLAVTLAVENMKFKSTGAVALDFLAGAVLKHWDHPSCSVELRTYAHQSESHLLVAEYTIANRDSSAPLVITVEDNFLPDSRDVSFHPPHVFEFDQHGVTCYHGLTKTIESRELQRSTIAICRSHIPAQLEIEPSGSMSMWILATVFSSPSPLQSELDSILPENILEAAKDRLIRSIANRHGLRFSHQVAMQTIWNSRIVLEGEPHTASIIYSSWWNILIGLHDDIHLSTSPGGLPNNCYQGHVFWDTEQFIWPSLLLFRPELARNCLRYRISRSPAAAAKALKNGCAYSIIVSSV